jgi:hypothetical protein
MPTGYTHNIPEGITYREFMLQCVRAMGVLITMRDDPASAPIPKAIKPSPYHKDRIAKAEEELARLEGLSMIEIEQECEDSNAAALRSYQEQRARSQHIRNAYEAMLTQVHEWEPPTEDHQGFKKFMAEQITESIRFDCHDIAEPVPSTPLDWHTRALEAAARDLVYHQGEWAKEQKNAAGRSAWLTAFWESLPPEE